MDVWAAICMAQFIMPLMLSEVNCSPINEVQFNALNI